MSEKFIPLTNHVLVEGIVPPNVGNIIVPEGTSEATPRVGIVLAVGPWVSEKSNINVGDKVLLPLMGLRRLRSDNLPRGTWLLLGEESAFEVKIEES